MKHTLLLFFFSFVLLFANAQQSIGERLAMNSPDPGDQVNITIFPNPATNHIGLSQSEGVARILVFNMVGRQMKKFKAASDSDHQYFVGDLPRGMYLIQIMGPNNEVITTKRISKR